MVRTIIFEFSNMVNDVTKNPHGAEPSAAVHAAAGDALLSLAADTSSVAATPVFANARGDSPREVDPSLVVDYECEPDEMADSGRLEQSPDRRQAADYEPLSKRVQSDRRVWRWKTTE